MTARSPFPICRVGVLLCLLACGTAARAESLLARTGVEAHGFIDARAGARTQPDPNERDMSLGEVRLQLDLERMGDLTTLQFKTDLLYDDIPDDKDPDLEEGTGPVDLRVLSLLVSPTDWLDVRLGRQPLTWGVGDLLFINDLFPKDWRSFFSGRDEEYLKAPSDALFLSLYPGFADINVAYTPRFDSDRYINGDRISYWNPMLGAAAGRDAVIDPVAREDWFADDELAVRLRRNVKGYDLAAYIYDGFWKNPVGLDPVAMRPCFPGLSVYGASLNGRLGKGILSLALGYYDSKDDSDGDDPFVPNDELRGLIGYQRELLKNFSATVQFYVEAMQDHAAYEAGLPPGAKPADEYRQVATLRLMKQALNQDLMLSLFVYWSPTDKDGYARPIATYKLTDAWKLTAGGNLFWGEEDHTFFGQFAKNSNLYGGLRYSF